VMHPNHPIPLKEHYGPDIAPYLNVLYQLWCIPIAPYIKGIGRTWHRPIP